MTENTNPMPQTASFSDQEKDTIRRGVFAASALVSRAEPGFFDSFKEAFSASKALAAAPAELREVLQGGLMMPPKATSVEDLDRQMLEQTHEAMRVADAKGPQVGTSVRELIQHVAQAAAMAAKDVSPKEQETIDKIMTASTVADTMPKTPEHPDAPAQTGFQQPGFQQAGAQPGQAVSPQAGFQQGQPSADQPASQQWQQPQA